MLKKLSLTSLAILVIFEEWLWDILTVAGQWLFRALDLQRFDEHNKTGPQVVSCLPHYLSE